MGGEAGEAASPLTSESTLQKLTHPFEILQDLISVIIELVQSIDGEGAPPVHKSYESVSTIFLQYLQPAWIGVKVHTSKTGVFLVYIILCHNVFSWASTPENICSQYY